MNERTGIDVDRLLHRVVDRSDEVADWDALDALAGRDPDTWERLASELRTDAFLRSAGDDLLEGAEAIELPTRRPRLRLLPSAGRLAAAALLVAIGWLLRDGAPAPASLDASRDEGAQLASDSSARFEDLGELVPVVVERRATDVPGEVELILVRRQLARQIVPALYEVGVDENDSPIVQSAWDAGATDVEFL